MQTYDLRPVLALGKHIYQFASSDSFLAHNELILREFLLWAGQGKAECVVLEESDSHELLGYFLLILDADCIDRFWKVPENYRQTTAYLAQIVIQPGLQAKGFGSKMLEEIETRAQANGKLKLRLEVASLNPAYQWYLKRNFTVWGSQHFMEKSFEDN
jgi:GNAT superfamily N-acetyltransferase